MCTPSFEVLTLFVSTLEPVKAKMIARSLKMEKIENSVGRTLDSASREHPFPVISPGSKRDGCSMFMGLLKDMVAVGGMP